MLYQEIAQGVSMPLLGFGTFLNTGNDCERSVAEAICEGYRLIDTAEAYGNERQVGNGIKASGVDRSELFLVTKINFKSYAHTRVTVENSLKQLGTDYLDLVLLHWPFADYYAAWRELEMLFRSRWLCSQVRPFPGSRRIILRPLSGGEQVCRLPEALCRYDRSSTGHRAFSLRRSLAREPCSPYLTMIV